MSMLHVQVHGHEHAAETWTWTGNGHKLLLDWRGKLTTLFSEAGKIVEVIKS
jgi:hypothetical protein